MASKPKSPSKTWHVLIGFDYCATDGEWKRVEPGVTVNDLPEADEAWLIRNGAIADAAPDELPIEPEAIGAGFNGGAEPTNDVIDTEE